MTVGWEPILAWPGALHPQHARRRSDFSASWDTTLDLLDREVCYLGASKATLMLAHPPHAFRADGMLHAKYRDRVPEHPGVVLVVHSRKHGELTYATDTFDRWRDNVRAIALGLESLRRIERYGIADGGQQYVGYRALGAGVPMGMRPAALTLDEAATILAAGFGAGSTYKAADVLADGSVARKCYVQAAQVVHPDNLVTGDADKFKRLDEAWRLVKDHHGLR